MTAVELPPVHADAPKVRGPGLDLAEVGAPLLLCSLDGVILDVTPEARALLHRAGLWRDALAGRVPEDTWLALTVAPTGQAVAPAPEAASSGGLVWTRYPAGAARALVMLRDAEPTPRQRRASVDAASHQRAKTLGLLRELARELAAVEGACRHIRTRLEEALSSSAVLEAAPAGGGGTDVPPRRLHG